MTSYFARLIGLKLSGAPVNLAVTDFVGSQRISSVDRLRRQSGGVIAGDAGALKDRHETIQPALPSSIVRVRRGLP